MLEIPLQGIQHFEEDPELRRGALAGVGETADHVLRGQLLPRPHGLLTQRVVLVHRFPLPASDSALLRCTRATARCRMMLHWHTQKVYSPLAPGDVGRGAPCVWAHPPLKSTGKEAATPIRWHNMLSYEPYTKMRTRISAFFRDGYPHVPDKTRRLS